MGEGVVMAKRFGLGGDDNYTSAWMKVVDACGDGGDDDVVMGKMEKEREGREKRGERSVDVERGGEMSVEVERSVGVEMSGDDECFDALYILIMIREAIGIDVNGTRYGLAFSDVVMKEGVWGVGVLQTNLNS
jgi:hypothetical protein